MADFLHVSVLVSRYSSLEDVRTHLSESLSGELENCPIYGGTETFLSALLRLMPGYIPV